ncbi:hypothetical protein OG455_26055 [Kitasatospora sp. NBC_01287]|uniref:hypothetical protein n=1 Tax=Kitasatospora sp. NBC_01287 TaxID=2903573 RepID=UPI002255AED3|nr:hypothetical protein [Kitasatospora sp. NBC_01287]MCX4748938.1 hypothetical protein [Kitasatospora sp. NBC_01287]
MMVAGMPQYRSLRPGEPPRFLGPAAESRAPGGRASVPSTAQRYDTVVVPLRLGLETVDILRLRRACGSVAQGAAGATLSFLVPSGTAERWHLPGTAAAPGAVPLTATDPRWLVPPAGPEAAAAPTDPWVLRSGLCEAARTLTASGLAPF